MKLHRLKKFLIASAIFLIVAAITTAVYLAKPVPTPKVSIEFQSFKPEKTTVFHLVVDTNDANKIFYRSDSRTNWWFRAFPSSENFSLEQTNAYCSVYLTNRSPTRIWWISMDCQVEARTSKGWITNIFGHFTTVPWSVGPSKMDVFSVYVPADAIEWRVTGEYAYYKNHSMKHEYVGWLSDDLNLGRSAKKLPKIIVYILVAPAWVFAILPEPKRSYDCKIYSEVFTNRPTINLSPAKPQP